MNRGHEREPSFNRAGGTNECLYDLDSMVQQKAEVILGVAPSAAIKLLRVIRANHLISRAWSIGSSGP